ncbi:MerR family transcriptional regulator [Jiangella ureilytica]|uniref:MerR family transcriptional regulator n=1 Tax=Jiangella ureilytica TaxID=2530374 RepID=A0A4R4RU06_9ACTN|nr:MerR family transcriptional regulator [Jiangella ureilytica]TDC53126.1 MerR family transcriptional regulator [Jiangella ureilytica]
MRIGDLAQRAGTTTRALRFYESQGLLMAQRAPNGYREYDDDDLRLVTEIQTLQRIGFSLDDTRPFVDCLRSGHDSGDACADSLETYRRKLAEVDGVLARLTRIRADIQDKLDDAEARHEGTDAR